ncbi:hypothetical protein HDA37_005727 [Pseudonocardia antarctica]|jgi:hypothetical protein|uniref:Uncharacterized protein n=1 Tax=Pseudonocardia alni TaxID=33907 RepID=A0A852W8Q1_PSEA5|nr:hypothetical protein [Pseudonocardia antarctica]
MESLVWRVWRRTERRSAPLRRAVVTNLASTDLPRPHPAHSRLAEGQGPVRRAPGAERAARRVLPPVPASPRWRVVRHTPNWPDTARSSPRAQGPLPGPGGDLGDRQSAPPPPHTASSRRGSQVKPDRSATVADRVQWPVPRAHRRGRGRRAGARHRPRRRPALGRGGRLRPSLEGRGDHRGLPRRLGRVLRLVRRRTPCACTRPTGRGQRVPDRPGSSRSEGLHHEPAHGRGPVLPRPAGPTRPDQPGPGHHGLGGHPARPWRPTRSGAAADAPTAVRPSRSHRHHPRLPHPPIRAGTGWRPRPRPAADRVLLAGSVAQDAGHQPAILFPRHRDAFRRSDTRDRDS